MAPNLIRIGRRSTEKFKKYSKTATFADAFFHVPFLGGIKSREPPLGKIGHWGWLCWGKGGLAGWLVGWLVGWLASEVAPPLRKERQRKALTRGKREDCTAKQRNQKEDERTCKHMKEEACQVNEKRKSVEKTSNSVIRSKNRRNDYSGSQCFCSFGSF